MTSKLMSHFSDVMSSDIDSGKKVTHEELGEQIESKLEENKWWKKQALGVGVGLNPRAQYWCVLLTFHCAVRNWIRGLVLQSHHSIWRKLRSQIICSN